MIAGELSHSERRRLFLFCFVFTVLGLKYVYDSSKEPESRLMNVQVNRYGDEEEGQLKWNQIENDKYYTVASREYTMNGGDGFEMFNEADNEIIVDDESGQALSVVLRNFFWAIGAVNEAVQVMNGDSAKSDQQFVNNLTALMKGLVVEVEDDAVDAQSDHSGSSKGSSPKGDDKVNTEEMKETDSEDTLKGKDELFLKIAPRIEQRITDVANEEEKEQENTVEREELFDSFAPSKWHHLPSWLHMSEKPNGVKSLAAFIATIQE